MKNKSEYRSEIAPYRKRNMMFQTQQLFVFNNRFTKIVARVAFTACLHVNLGFASFKSLIICPRPQQEATGRKDKKKHVHQGHKGESEHLFYSLPTTSIRLFYFVICFVSSVVVFGLGREDTRAGSHQEDGGPGDVWSAAGGMTIEIKMSLARQQKLAANIGRQNNVILFEVTMVNTPNPLQGKLPESERSRVLGGRGD